jgi:Secretion system C-terminal sorting domain
MPCPYTPEPPDGSAASPGFKIYPNPATDRTNIDAASLLAPNTTAAVKVYAANGRLVHTQLANNPLFTINCLGWMPGMYYVKMTIGNKNYQAGFLKT